MYKIFKKLCLTIRRFIIFLVNIFMAFGFFKFIIGIVFFIFIYLIISLYNYMYIENIIFFYFYYTIYSTILIFLFSYYSKYFSANTIYIYYNYYILLVITIVVQFVSLNSIFNFTFGLEIFSYINSFIHKNIVFDYNNTSCLFSSITIQIAVFSNIFSYYYNYLEVGKYRFFLILNYFVFSMVFLLHSKSIIILFLFWELIGFSSFFLINFFSLKQSVFKSALKAMFFNKISDFSLLLAMLLYYIVTNTFVITEGTLNFFIFNPLFINFFFFKITTLNLFIFFLAIAAFIKSAQFFFHWWLPDSMEAPLPASALIHSATLVASGVYLFFKFYNVILYNSKYINIFLLINSFTFFMGAVVASLQSDLKKILAYSTISNCGLMFTSLLSLGELYTIFFFLMHGYYKSISFLILSFFIISFYHRQDIRNINSNNVEFLLIGAILAINLMSLSSWFFLSNSYIKHQIISYSNYNLLNKIFLILGTLFSYQYSIRLLYLFTNNRINSVKKYVKSSNDINYYITICVYINSIILVSLFILNIKKIYILNDIYLNKYIIYIMFYQIFINLLLIYKKNINFVRLIVLCFLFIL